MKFIKPYGLIFPVVVAVALLGNLSGQRPHPTDGLTPYSASLHWFEEGVFSRNQEVKANTARQLERALGKKIVRLITRYASDMDPVARKKISRLIIDESKKYGYDPLFLAALIVTESSFDHRARSHRGALGLMQIRPNTAAAIARETNLEWKGHPTLFDPASNIAMGAFYLNKMIHRFGDLSLALEAYNCGPTKLSRFLKNGVQPKIYSQKVLGHYERFKAGAI